MRNTKEPADTSVAYEVFKIGISKPVTLVGKTGKSAGKEYFYPAAEKFPGNEDFGRTAWTFSKKATALAHFEVLSVQQKK